MSLAERFRKVRNISGLNQKKFAKLIGITQGHVSGIETGKEPGISKSLAKVIELLWGVSSEWLKTDKGNMFFDGKKILPYVIIGSQTKEIKELKNELTQWKKAVVDLADVADKKKVRKK